MKTIISKISAFVGSGMFLLFVGAAQAAPFSVTIGVDENGHGTLSNTLGFIANLTGTRKQDPGPGGLPSALTYDLLNPPGLVAGDLFLFDLGSETYSDLIRFNSSNGSLVFYSDVMTGGGTLGSIADIGFPTAFYTNTLSLTELGPEGNSGFTYTPTSTQPGFVAGAEGLVTYVIKSDVIGRAVPEPGSIALFGLGLLGFAVSRRKSAK